MPASLFPFAHIRSPRCSRPRGHYMPVETLHSGKEGTHMQITLNNQKSKAAKVFWVGPLRSLAALVATLLLMVIPLHAQTDPRSIMGGGNFENGNGDSGTGATAADQYNALTILGAKMSRMNIYPGYYWNGSAATPTAVQSGVLQAHTNGITPMILF